MSNLFRSLVVVALSAVAFAVVTTSASAAVVTLDCKLGCNLATIPGDTSGVLWSTETVHPSGTGVFDPFVRIQGKGGDNGADIEDGHNTDGKLSNDEKNGTWTHSVLTSDLATITFNDPNTNVSTTYYQFMLDLGEPADLDKSLLSLDQFKICTGSSGSLTKEDDCPVSPYHYNMDDNQVPAVDATILLDYNLIGQGNGGSDLFVYVPAALFVDPDDFFYLYTSFGEQQGNYLAQGTFEEWAAKVGGSDTTGDDTTSGGETTGPTGVPEPGTLSLLGAGLALVGYRLRRRT
jgi:hypothetical protein